MNSSSGFAAGACARTPRPATNNKHTATSPSLIFIRSLNQKFAITKSNRESFVEREKSLLGRFDWKAFELQQAPHGVSPHAIRCIPGGPLIEKIEPRIRAAGELRIARHLLLELFLQLRVSCHHVARQRLHHIRFAILLLLED